MTLSRRSFLKGTVACAGSAAVAAAGLAFVRPTLPEVEGDPRLWSFCSEVAKLVPFADRVIGEYLNYDQWIGIAVSVGSGASQWRTAVRFVRNSPERITPEHVADRLTRHYEAMRLTKRVGVWGDDRLEGKEERITA